MIRRTVGAVVASTAALLMLAFWTATSWAGTVPPYPAPPVTTPVDPAVVTSTASVLPVQPVPAATDLATTGAGFNVGLTVAIGLVIVAVGIALVVLGARRSRHSNHA